MRFFLPALPDPLRALAWRVLPPALSELPDPPAGTIERWTGVRARPARTRQGWTAWWAHAGGRVTMIYEHHVFVSIASVEVVPEDLVQDVVDALLRASIDLTAREPVALADLL